MFDQFGLDKALLEESLLILENLQGAVLSVFVIVTLENHAETALSDFLDNFIPVTKMLVDFAQVFVRVSVKTVICCLVEDAHF